MAAALCLGTHYLGRKFNFRPGFYHFFGASLLGYFGGKMSYRSICQERLIASKSNSPFVNAIRKRQGVFVQSKSNKFKFIFFFGTHLSLIYVLYFVSALSNRLR